MTSALQWLSLINTILNMSVQAGVNWRQVQSLVSTARAEGRELTQAELQVLADEAQGAIDEL